MLIKLHKELHIAYPQVSKWASDLIYILSGQQNIQITEKILAILSIFFDFCTFFYQTLSRYIKGLANIASILYFTY